MDDLKQFLRARLDEDERIAQAATPGPWEQSGIGEYGWGVTFSRTGAGVEAEDSDQGRADADHIARHNPARVFAEIDAKRKILESIVSTVADMAESIAFEYGTRYSPPGPVAAELLRLLALPYANHPDYNEAWRP